MSTPRPHPRPGVLAHGEYAVSIMLGRGLADYLENSFTALVT